jgi:hypothetical protein
VPSGREATGDRRDGPADVLRAARRRDSLVKRERVLATLQRMQQTGDIITVAAVARAQVSTWLVFAESTSRQQGGVKALTSLRRVTAARDGLDGQRTELEDEPAAARTSLRRMICKRQPEPT